MKHLIVTLFIFLVGTGLFSCTITKRHFGNGYHIEWRKKPSSSEFEISTDHEIDSKRESLSSEIIPEDEVQTIQREIEVVKPLVDKNSENIERHTPKTNSYPEEKEFKKEHLDSPERDDELYEEAEQKVYPLTWFMMGIPVLIILSYVLVMQSIYLIGGAGIVIFGFIGLILGIVSLVTVKKHPEKYKRTKLTKIFSMICIISGGIIVYSSILYFSLFKH